MIAGSTEAAASSPIWLSILAGGLSGLLASVVGHVLLSVPRIKVKTYHDTRLDPVTGEATIMSYVKATNLRGRPVHVEGATILTRGSMSQPKSWTFDFDLAEGASVRFTFDRAEYPNAKGVVMDTAGRVWPRRRWFAVRRRATMQTGWFAWRSRNGPTDRQLRRARRRFDLPDPGTPPRSAP